MSGIESTSSSPAAIMVNQLSQAALQSANNRQSVTESGNSVPVVPQKSASVEEIAEAVVSISDYVQNFSRDLQFQVDDLSGHTIVTVKDSETEEIVRQIPTEEVIAIARYIAEFGADPVKGLLVSGES